MTKEGGVLITGAAKRIGRSIALALAAEGRAIAVHYNGSDGDAEETVRAIEAAGGRAVAVQADLGDHDASVALLPRAAERLATPIDVLVNNASLFENDNLRSVSRDSFDRHMSVNLRAPLFLAQQFADALPSDRTGNIVNLVDMRVRKPTPGFMSYTLSKAGLDMLTKTLAMALAPRVRVNAIGPGPVLPNERQTEEQFARQWRSTLLERGAEPEEIAAGVRFILSAPSLTGQMITLDGGQHIPWPPPRAGADDLDG